MRLLLTSAGIKNASIHAALVDLLGRPIAECSALCIPTAAHRAAEHRRGALGPLSPADGGAFPARGARRRMRARLLVFAVRGGCRDGYVRQLEDVGAALPPRKLDG